VNRSLEQFDINNPDESVRIGKLCVLLYETTLPELGMKQTAVLLHQPIKGGSRELLCDIDRLEAVVGHGNRLKASIANEPGRSLEQEPKLVGSLELGSWSVRYLEQKDPDGKPQLMVVIDQQNDKGRQQFANPFGQFEEANKHALLFEHQKGHERPWYAVVKVVELKDSDMVRLRVVKWDTYAQARDYAAKNWTDGYALFQVAFRRQLGGKEGFTLDIEERRIPDLAPELAADINYLKAKEDRRTLGLLLGVWCQKGETPRPGMVVKFDEIGRDPQTREPTPYRVIPTAIERPQGPGEKPVHVVVEIDTEFHPPRHRIKEVILEPERAEARFRELVALAPKHRRQLESAPKQEPMPELNRANMPELNRGEGPKR